MSCKQCGWCCRNIAAFYKVDAIRDEFMLARGWRRVQTSKDGTHTMWILKHMCPNLSQENKCRIYDTRPIACRAYPNSLAARFVELGMDAQTGVGRKCGWNWNGEKYT